MELYLTTGEVNNKPPVKPIFIKAMRMRMPNSIYFCGDTKLNDRKYF